MTVHRKRRIAADEAHSWARNLRLKNPYAKLVLGMLTLYVDGNGVCFVGIEALAEDSELSTDTVRKRLAWLEGVGAIARFPQWIDGNGRRNGEGKGKRTSDEIRLLMDADPEMIEARAAGVETSIEEGSAEHQTEPVSPSHQQGLTQPAETAGPGLAPPLALGQPSDSGKGLDSSEPELEPESPPYPPPGGVGQRSSDEESEAVSEAWAHAESWKRAEDAWGDPILHQDICRVLWGAFTELERERFIRVIRGYLAWRLKQPKLPNRCNLQKLMRERDAWPGYEKLAGADPQLRTFIVEHSREYDALAVLDRIIEYPPPIVAFDVEQGARGYWRKLPVPADLAGLAMFASKPVEQFTRIDDGTEPFNAWADRIKHWIGIWPKQLRVPSLYPPRKDGTFADATGPPPDA